MNLYIQIVEIYYQLRGFQIIQNDCVDIDIEFWFVFTWGFSFLSKMLHKQSLSNPY
jgi:hypothetical protein